MCVVAEERRPCGSALGGSALGGWSLGFHRKEHSPIRKERHKPEHRRCKELHRLGRRCCKERHKLGHRPVHSKTEQRRWLRSRSRCGSRTGASGELLLQNPRSSQ